MNTVCSTIFEGTEGYPLCEWGFAFPSFFPPQKLLFTEIHTNMNICAFAL